MRVIRIDRSPARVRRSAAIAAFAMCCFLTGSASAQTARILLVGDSWVAQAWQARAFDTALENKGLGQFTEVGGATTIGGTTAAQWATATYLQLITNALAANPTIDIVHLSMGGNDFLAAPPGSNLVELAAQILADQQTVVDHVFSIRPTARVTISTYDYIPTGMNAESVALATLSVQQTSTTPGYFTLNQLGVLHHVFGADGVFAPGETPLPGNFPSYDPIGGGDPSVPGQAAVFRDSIHPTDAGYVALAEHAIDAYYAPWLLGAPLVPVLQPWSAFALCSALVYAGYVRSGRAARAERNV